jgi:hypothetical protein
MPPRTPDPHSKRQTLRRQGTLNPHPEAVAYPLCQNGFQNGGFFDLDDLMQVKYEMLRQVHVDQRSVRESADACGLSRPSFYQAQAALQAHGLVGLFAHKRGPQSGHKLTTGVMEFVGQMRTTDPNLTSQQLADSVQSRFRVQVHPRSIQRQLLRKKHS